MKLLSHLANWPCQCHHDHRWCVQPAVAQSTLSQLPTILQVRVRFTAACDACVGIAPVIQSLGSR